MDIRGSLDGLKSLLGVNPAAQPTVANKGSATTGKSLLGSDHATLSSAGSEVAQTAADESVRFDKVAGVQAALAAGTYSVPTSAVASKLVDTMLGAGQS